MGKWVPFIHLLYDIYRCRDKFFDVNQGCLVTELSLNYIVFRTENFAVVVHGMGQFARSIYLMTFKKRIGLK